MIQFPQHEKKSQRWSEEDIALLRELAATLLVTEIAKRLQRTRASVESKAKELGIVVQAAPATQGNGENNARFPGRGGCASLRPSQGGKVIAE